MNEHIANLVTDQRASWSQPRSRHLGAGLIELSDGLSLDLWEFPSLSHGLKTKTDFSESRSPKLRLTF